MTEIPITIPPPDTQVKSETLEEIAESIARRGLPFSAFRNESEWRQTKAWLVNEVLSCLRNERERCAKVAETIHDDKVFDVDLILRNEIAKAIREGR